MVITGKILGYKNIVITNLLLLFSTYPFSIYIDSPNKDHLGYGNCNSLTNGEYTIIQQYIKPGDIVIDAGAHKGDWSELVLHHTNDNCSIYAFEPVPVFFEYLIARLCSRANCYNIALGKEESESVMYYCKENGDWSSFFNRPVFSNIPVEPISVSVTSLDTFCKKQGIDHISFLKIDTEGYEWNVLQGAEQFIMHNSVDIIQFEYGGTYPDAGVVFHEVYHFLQAKGYNIFRIIPDGLIHIPAWRNELENAEYSNYLAIHDSYTERTRS